MSEHETYNIFGKVLVISIGGFSTAHPTSNFLNNIEVYNNLPFEFALRPIFLITPYSGTGGAYYDAFFWGQPGGCALQIDNLHPNHAYYGTCCAIIQ